MERFSEITPLSVPPKATFSLEKATETHSQSQVLLKSYQCNSLEDANQLLKTVLYLQQQGSLDLPLLPPCLSGLGPPSPYNLTLVWERTGTFYESVLCQSWEMSWPPAKTAYRRGVAKHKDPHRKVSEVFSDHFNKFCIVNTYTCDNLEDVNSALQVAFVQASLTHEYICPLLDLVLYCSRKGR